MIFTVRHSSGSILAGLEFARNSDMSSGGILFRANLTRALSIRTCCMARAAMRKKCSSPRIHVPSRRNFRNNSLTRAVAWSVCPARSFCSSIDAIHRSRRKVIP